jgi:hypothetical protein
MQGGQITKIATCGAEFSGFYPGDSLSIVEVHAVSIATETSVS